MIKKEAPTTLYVVSEKYGVVDSKLSTGFTENVEKAEKKYKIENIPNEVIDICKEIQGVAGRALLVGGSVRDCVISREHPEMKLKPKDFDIEVYGLSIENLQRVLETKFGPDNVDSVGRSFGIIKVRIAGWDEPLDFSIPRTDSKSGEGHKGFDVEWKPELDVKAAAARRDITVNTMAYDPLTETIYDPYGGIKDIENRVIRITDEKAFREDPLRVIRIMQFAARFEFTVDPATEEICKQMVAEGELVIRKVDRSGDSFVPGESEKDGEEKTGFMVASGSQEIYLKPKTRN